VATYPDDATDPDQLMRTADRALYAAKQKGRDRVETVSKAAQTNGSSRDLRAEGPAEAGQETIAP